MNSKIFTWFVAAFLPWHLACDGAPEGPRFGLVAGNAAGAALDGGLDGGDFCGDFNGPVQEGDGFFAVAVLPGGVETDAKLEVRAQSACVVAEAEGEFVDGRAVVSVVAPEGANCSLTVNMKVLNASHACVLGADGDCSTASCRDR